MTRFACPRWLFAVPFVAFATTGCGSDDPPQPAKNPVLNGTYVGSNDGSDEQVTFSNSDHRYALSVTKGDETQTSEGTFAFDFEARRVTLDSDEGEELRLSLDDITFENAAANGAPAGGGGLLTNALRPQEYVPVGVLLQDQTAVTIIKVVDCSGQLIAVYHSSTSYGPMTCPLGGYLSSGR
jgi:hypothetical protein